MKKICLISPYVHFDLRTASGNVVFARRLSNCLNKVYRVIIISGKRSLKTYPSVFKGTILCYKTFLKTISEKNVDIVHLVDIPLPSLYLFHKKSSDKNTKLVYHLWTAPNYSTKLMLRLFKKYLDIIRIIPALIEAVP